MLSNDYRNSCCVAGLLEPHCLRTVELVDLRKRNPMASLVNEEFEMRPYSLSSTCNLQNLFRLQIWAKVTHEFLSFFSFRMEAVFAWCKGVKFVEVQKMTGSFEGTTIRTLRRLEELVRQITVAAKAIGDKDLEEKFMEGGKLIKRDIVFCNSLYL